MSLIQTYLKKALGSDLMSHKSLQKVVCYFLKLLNCSNMCSNNSLLLLVYSDCSEDLSIHELLVPEVSECRWQLSLILLIENDLDSVSIVI